MFIFRSVCSCSPMSSFLAKLDGNFRPLLVQAFSWLGDSVGSSMTGCVEIYLCKLRAAILRVCDIYIYINIHIYIYTEPYNANLGLLIRPDLKTSAGPKKFGNLKTGGPPWLINRMINKPSLWKSFFCINVSKLKSNCISWILMVQKGFHMISHPSLLIIEKFKKKHVPKWSVSYIFFVKRNISFTSSQRVPPMSSCPPLIIDSVPPY